jgi:hypothetical protein
VKDPYLSAEPDHCCNLESWLGSDAMRWLWQDGQYDVFSDLRQVLRAYKDARVYREGARLYFCSMSVNAHEDVDVEVSFDSRAPVPEIAAARCWVSYLDDNLGRRIYADPPFIEIGCRNPRGWGVLERPGYVAAANACGFGLPVLSGAKKWLDANPIVVY